MVLPAVLGSLAPYAGTALEYAPYAIAAFEALYALSKNLGDRYGNQLRDIKRQYKERGFDAIKEHRNDILRAAGYAVFKGVEGASEVYRQIKTNLSGHKTSKPHGDRPRREGEIKSVRYVGKRYENPRNHDKTRATVTATLIILSSLSLSYFTLTPKITTAHLNIPSSISTIGIILSLMMFCLGIWVFFKKGNRTIQA